MKILTSYSNTQQRTYNSNKNTLLIIINIYSNSPPTPKPAIFNNAPNLHNVNHRTHRVDRPYPSPPKVTFTWALDGLYVEKIYHTRSLLLQAMSGAHLPRPSPQTGCRAGKPISATPPAYPSSIRVKNLRGHYAEWGWCHLVARAGYDSRLVPVFCDGRIQPREDANLLRV